jgi:hypothetical protein
MNFTFTHNETEYRVRTEVGNGAARVIVEERQTEEAAPIEPSEEG